jgi:hypothetical protein
MNKEKLLTALTKALGKDTMLSPKGFVEENHKPHQFRVGAKHQLAAAEENEGVLTEEICQRIPCEHLYCNLSYEEHTSDKTLVLQLTRDAEQTDVMNELVKIKPLINEHNIKAVKFADSIEGFKFLVNGEEPNRTGENQVQDKPN